MPVFVTTQIGDKLSEIVRLYQSTSAAHANVSLETVARLNGVTEAGYLPPKKILVLPDSGNRGQCGHLDHQAVALARSMENKAYDPLKTLLTTGWGNELLASLEILEGINAQGEVKAAFGGALGASKGQYQQFLAANQAYKNLLKEYATASESLRRSMTRRIVEAARKVEQLYMQVVAVFVRKRKGGLPRRLKQVPHVDMHYARANGLKSTVIKSSNDLSRVRSAARGARVFAAGALLLDIGLAGKNIKHAHETGGNTTRVAFEELGGLLVEGAGAASAGYLVGSGITLLTGFFPFLLIPGVGLVLIITAGALGAVYGNDLGKFAGRMLYDYTEKPVHDLILNES